MARNQLVQAAIALILLVSPRIYAACDDVVRETAAPLYGWGMHLAFQPFPLASEAEACAYHYGPSGLFPASWAICSLGGKNYCTHPSTCEEAKREGATSIGSSFGSGAYYGPYWCPNGFENFEREPVSQELVCVRYIPPPPKSITLINPSPEQPASGAYLAEVEPQIPDVNVFGVVRSGNGSRSRVPLRARVTCGNGQPAPGAAVQFNVDVVDRSGGHDHVDGRHVWPHRGGVLVQNAYTNAEGYVDFTFLAPVAAGDHTIQAECVNMLCGREERRVWVGIKDLSSLYPTHLYRLVGSVHPHVRNHFLTAAAMGNLIWLAESYKARFPTDPVLHVNDASLERGGIFDLRSNWQPSHHSHREGMALDLVANPAQHPTMAIPTTNFGRFEEMACERGWWATLELPGTPNQHFHAEFELQCFTTNSESVEANFSSPPSDPNPNPVCGPNPDPQTMPWCF